MAGWKSTYPDSQKCAALMKLKLLTGARLGSKPAPMPNSNTPSLANLKRAIEVAEQIEKLQAEIRDLLLVGVVAKGLVVRRRRRRRMSADSFCDSLQQLQEFAQSLQPSTAT